MFKKIFKAIEDMNERLAFGEDVTELEVENFVGIFAVLYAAANADGISKSELEVITLYKYNMTRALNRPNRRELRDVFYNESKELDSIESISNTIKLSQALKYFPVKENVIEEEIKDILRNLITEIINADGVITEEEQKIRDRLSLFCEKGQIAIKEIEELEEKDI